MWFLLKCLNHSSLTSPLKFTSELEEAAMKASSTVLPNINLKGCYFHFGQCLGRKLKSVTVRADSQVPEIQIPDRCFSF